MGSEFVSGVFTPESLNCKEKAAQSEVLNDDVETQTERVAASGSKT